MKEKVSISDRCAEGFVNTQKCHYNNCSLSRTASNVWTGRNFSIQVDESDNTKWTVVNNLECLNHFGIPLPESHCSGCNFATKLQVKWDLQGDSWINASDFCLNMGVGWRLFDQFDGISEHLIVDQFRAFRNDGTFPGNTWKIWIGVVYSRNGDFVAASDETKELSQYFQQRNQYFGDPYLALYAHMSGNGKIVVNDHNSDPFIFFCSRYI